MALAELELVMLESGEIALQRIGANEPLVRIAFSPEVMSYLSGKHLDVAKSMIDAGIQTAFEVGDDAASRDQQDETKVHNVH